MRARKRRRGPEQRPHVRREKGDRASQAACAAEGRQRTQRLAIPVPRFELLRHHEAAEERAAVHQSTVRVLSSAAGQTRRAVVGVRSRGQLCDRRQCTTSPEDESAEDFHEVKLRVNHIETHPAALDEVDDGGYVQRVVEAKAGLHGPAGIEVRGHEEGALPDVCLFAFRLEEAASVKGLLAAAERLNVRLDRRAVHRQEVHWRLSRLERLGVISALSSALCPLRQDVCTAQA